MSFKHILAITFLSITTFCVVIIAGAMPINNIRLFTIQNQFNKIHSKDIAQSRLLTRKAEVSHWGESNICDYHLGHFRASSLSKEEIKKAYEGLTTSSFKGDENSPLEVQVFFSYEDWMGPYYWSDWWEDNMHKFNLAPNETPYLVFVGSGGHSAAGDIRCH